MTKRFLLLSLMAAIGFTPSEAQTIVALTAADQLIQITNAGSPGSVSTPVSITGISAGQSVVGIDYRPNTGELYALGYDALLPALNTQVYTINVMTGAATAINALPVTLSLGTGSIGFDFNPAVDRIRVVAANGANYRLHPTNGTIVATDFNLAYEGSDVNASATPQIGACAYTNSYIGSESTTLYNYDEILNVLTTQIPPNNGTLNTVGSSTISVNTLDPTIGMDIYFDPVSKTNMAYLNANVGTNTNDDLYSINLTTGAATLIGQIGSGLDIKEIAVQINRTVPATYTGQLVYGLTKTNRNLVKFSTGNPQLIRELLPITGVTAGQIIVGMDVRPLDLGLYALGYNETNRQYQLYSINKTTGAATTIGSAGTLTLGMGERIGFDFNPTVDRIRVVSTNDSNFRLNPLNGTIVATDSNLAYAVGDQNNGTDPEVSNVAYINSYKGATATTLYGLDDSANVFFDVTPPNLGKLNTIGSTGIVFNQFDRTNDIDFYYDSTAAQNIGYMIANTGTSLNDDLYMFITTGVATKLDTIGFGIQLSDLAVQLTFTNTNMTGINDVDKKQLFTIYPNPVQALLTVKFDNTVAANTELIITDVTGRIVKMTNVSKTASQITVDVSGFGNGLYFISLSNKTSKTIRFIKN